MSNKIYTGKKIIPTMLLGTQYAAAHCVPYVLQILYKKLYSFPRLA